MVRQANAAADTGKLGRNNVAQLQQALEEFDQIFDVVRDSDAEKIREIIEWAQVQGKEIKISVSGNHISDARVEALVAERNAAKKLRDFARSDAIRKQLAEAGIILEDTKDGVRWKRQ